MNKAVNDFDDLSSAQTGVWTRAQELNHHKLKPVHHLYERS